MKKIYRSIAVTVLAALMALPMVVRAEDKKKVKEVQVTFLKDTGMHSYIGETKEDLLKRMNKELKFEAVIDGVGERPELEVIEVKLQSEGTRKEYKGAIWPFKQNGNDIEYEPEPKLKQRYFELTFKERAVGAKYEFDGHPNLSINGNVLQAAGSTRYVFGNPELTGVKYELANHVYREIHLADFDNGSKIKFKNISASGEPNLPELVIPLEVSNNETLGSLLKKKGENKADAHVEYELQQGVDKDAWFCRIGDGKDIFVDPNLIDVMTYNLNPMKKSDASTIVFLAKGLGANEKMPHLEAVDVKIKADQNLKLKDLIKLAITMATPDVLEAQGTIDVENVKAFFLNGAALTQNDIDDARANGKKSLEIQYQYTPVEGDLNSCIANAKLFIEPVAAPNPPAPAPQPQPKQQEETGNAYFDLGRNFLPTCPDSKCAKAGTNAKKDDVPNTAAAANN